MSEWPDGQEDQPSGERPTEEVASPDTRGTTDETDKPAKRSRERRNGSGNLTRMETWGGAMMSTLKWTRESI